MERLKHNNDIEIKLLANRRFIYANRRSNVVITAENKATDICVLFPEEYEDYSKRVDFINSAGKEWTEGLYTPEFKKYKGGFSKTRFHFTLPTEVTTEGELKMQFLAYLPDESMTTVPFEVILIDIQCGMLAFKRSSKSNPDLLILAANKSEQALFNSQKAVAKSTEALANSEQAVETANKAVAGLEDEIERAMRAEADLAAGLAAEVERAMQAEADITAALNEEIERATAAEDDLREALGDETAERIAGDAALAEAIADEQARAEQAEAQLTAGLQGLTDALETEVERATQAENDLRVSTTENADAIAAEAARAIAAENTIAADLAAEISRAQTAEQINADAIQTESNRAQAAEAGLLAGLNTERDRAIAAENNLHSELISESSRSMQAEAELRADLNSEITRAQTSEQINADAIAAETQRATNAEAALGARIDTEVPAALSEAKAYADQVSEQVRVDGTIYKGTIDETELLQLTGNENGDLYWISDFDITQPDHSGSAIFNGKTNKWDYNIDRYKHQDNDTIVARPSDGALKVADTDEASLTPDTTDFGGSVQLGFKGMIRSLIRKIRGLFQRTTENAAAITTETTRAMTAESTLSSNLSAEVTRAKAAEQINANAIQAEVLRATQAEGSLSDRITAETARSQTAESGLSARITAEEARAKTAEQTNATAIAAETTRAMSAESGLASSIMAEEARAKAAEQANASAIAAEETRASLAEQALAQSILDNAKKTQADWNETDVSAVTFIHNKPAAMPASDVYPWAKTITKPVYTATEVGAEPAFNKNTAFNKNFGSAAGTVCEGNDGRLTNARTLPIYTTGGTGAALTITAPELGTAYKNGLTFILIPHTSITTSAVTLSVNGLTARKFYRQNASGNGFYPVSDNSFLNLGSPHIVSYRDSASEPFWVLQGLPLVFWENVQNRPTSMPASDVSAWAKAASKPTYTASEVGAEPAFTKNTAFNKNFGSAAGTVCEGNDTRLSNSRPASDVSAWAKAASKPTYTAAEVGAEPAFTKNTGFNKNFGTAAGTVCQGNDSRLSDARTPTAHTHANADLTGIAAWAKAASKPTYTASEVGAEPAFSKNTAFNRSFGTTSGTVCEGNDTRLSNARTPTAHATSSTTYGQGDATNYGHVRLSSLAGSTTILSSGDCALRYNYDTAASDINLNNYVYVGQMTLYNVPTTITDSANNFPSGWNTGSQNSNTAYLEVRRFFSNTGIHQTLYKRATIQRWVRVYNGSSWTAWKEVDAAAGAAVTGANVSITANTNLGNATTVQAALNYIANVFAGTQKVTRISAVTFDAD